MFSASEVDVGQREGDRQRYRLVGRVGKLIVDGDALERDAQILALHCDRFVLYELQSADRELGGGIIGEGGAGGRR